MLETNSYIMIPNSRNKYRIQWFFRIPSEKFEINITQFVAVTDHDNID